MANRTAMFSPINSANIMQAGQEAPTIVNQPEGMVHYVQYAGQQFGNPSNPLQQIPQTGVMEKLLKVETKTLGAIQIMIGLIHIGFGTLLHFVDDRMDFLRFATFGQYPLWGGLLFIISGSLSVPVEKYLNVNLVKCSVGMNIVSAIATLFGITAYIAELVVRQGYSNRLSVISMDAGFSTLLLLFSTLEFCITVSGAHFGCQATCCSKEVGIALVPYTVIGGSVNPAEGNPGLPAHHNVTPSPSSEA
ncbi:membrane-spanning 4-domains subfamily A member 12-like isoform X1 [Elgaria multicarinata webbii]|uniref:membrane-spanning 4-domains subfamily A member 12-like isoform X1 n=1 Tax=Elgaria multicarinata webbii TaxID=159646 RepID=UPI002FCD0277